MKKALTELLLIVLGVMAMTVCAMAQNSNQQTIIKIGDLPPPPAGSVFLTQGDIVPANRTISGKANTYQMRISFGAVTCGPSQWVNNISPNGNSGCAQPGITDIAGLGTAAGFNTGTSGATIPLLNGTNTWSNSQTILGGLLIGTATGGLQGTGSINAQSLFINGVAVTGGTSPITVGTSATATNPSRASDLTTGIFSIGTSTLDVSAGGAEVMRWNTIASGVDYVGVTAGTSGVAPLIQPGGTTTNQGLTIKGKGTGSLALNTMTIGSTGIITNGTFDTAGSGNVFKINGTAISAVSGTGSVCLTNSCALTTPTFQTSIMGPLVIGGSTTTSTLGFQATTASGTSAAGMTWTVGSANTAMRLSGDGGLSIGTTVSMGQGTINLGSSTPIYVNGVVFGGGSGSGTVSSGTANQLTYYASSGTTVSGNANITTDASGDLKLAKDLLWIGTSAPGSLSNIGVTSVPIGTQIGLNTTNFSDVKLGLSIGTTLTLPSDSVYIGNEAGNQMTTEGFYELTGGVFGNGVHNVAIGAFAMGAASPVGCTARSGATSYTVAVGAYAGAFENCTNGGFDNTYVGDHAAYFAQTASGNTVVGGDTMGLFSGTTNTIVGYNATGFGGNLTGSNNLILGQFVASTTLTSGSNNILIGTGSNIDTPANNTSNFMDIGHAIFGNSLPTGTAVGTSALIGIGTASPKGELAIYGARSIASAAGAVWDDLTTQASTTTLTGTTHITNTKGFNKVSIYAPTVTDSSSVTVDQSASLYVDSAPVAAGSVTLSNNFAIRVGSGNVNFPGTGNAMGTITSGTWSATPLLAAELPADVAYQDVNQTWTRAQRPPQQTITASPATTYTPNFDTGVDFTLTLSSSCPCTLANPSTTPVAGQSGAIYVVQDASGSRTITTWGSNYVIAGGTGAITLSTGANDIDVFTYKVKDSTHIVLSGPSLNVAH